MMSNTDVSPDDRLVTIGQKVYMGGCGAQLVFVLLFCGIIIRLHIKTTKECRHDIDMRRPQLLAWVMFAVLMMITVSWEHG